MCRGGGVGGGWRWWCALNRYNVVITVSSGILLSSALVCDTWIVISVVSLVGLFVITVSSGILLSIALVCHTWIVISVVCLVGLFVMIMHAFRDLVKDDTLIIIIIIICWRKSGGGKKTAVSNVV